MRAYRYPWVADNIFMKKPPGILKYVEVIRIIKNKKQFYSSSCNGKKLHNYTYGGSIRVIITEILTFL